MSVREERLVERTVDLPVIDLGQPSDGGKHLAGLHFVEDTIGAEGDMFTRQMALGEWKQVLEKICGGGMGPI